MFSLRYTSQATKSSQELILQKGVIRMKKALYILIAVIMISALMVVPSMAKKYSAAPSGQGVSTIGTGGDYATIKDASLDFNTTANTGNWTMQILSDLTEPANVAFGNNVVSSNTILLVPATGVTATVTFTTTADNTGPSGSFMVGTNSLDAYSLFTVNNFIIDGSNNGSTTRNLTFQTVTSCAGYVYLIRGVGAAFGFTIKNCNLIANGGTATSEYGVQMGVRKVGTEVMAPNNFKVLNCYIVSTQFWAAQGIGFGFTGLVAATDSVINGYEIRDNTILVRTRGIFINGGLSGSIVNNTIRDRQTDTGYSSSGIWHYSTNGRTDYTMNIIGNKIDSLVSANSSAGSYGLVAVDIGITGGTYNVYNNMIGGYSYINSAATTNMQFRGIVSGAGGISYYNIMNNSIDLPINPVLAAESANQCFGIGFTSSAFTGVVTTLNNIVRIGQPGGACLFSATTSFSSLASDYNDFYPASGAIVANIPLLSGVYTNLAAWQGALGKDANSQSVDPYVTSPSKWVSLYDLHFNPYVATASASPLTAGTPIAWITTDIDGQARSGSAPWKGADELVTLPFITPNAISTNPGAAAIQLVAAGGTAPYTWSLSTAALGTLNTTSGATVQFTPTASLITISGTVNVSDNNGKTNVATVFITPTEAPLARE